MSIPPITGPGPSRRPDPDKPASTGFADALRAAGVEVTKPEKPAKPRTFDDPVPPPPPPPPPSPRDPEG